MINCLTLLSRHLKALLNAFFFCYITIQVPLDSKQWFYASKHM